MTHATIEETEEPRTSVPHTSPPEDAPPREPSDLMPRVLRGIGAVLLVIAASSFMFRDWGQHDDVTRYLMLLGQLVLLTAAGFFCGLKLDEKRGARTFLSLVVAVIPVHFAVLGGVLYSQLAMDAPTSALPTFAVWRATDATTAIGLALGAQLVLLPATFVAMLTLVRRHAIPMTLAFVGLNALLLLPIREPDVVAAVIACVAPLALLFQLRVLARTPSLETKQGRYVRAMLPVPVLVLVGRTVLYYPITAPFLGVLLLAIGLAVFVFAVHLHDDQTPTRFAAARATGVATMIAGWLVTVGRGPLTRIFDGGAEAFDVPLLTLPAAAIVLLASERTPSKLPYRRLGAALATFGVCVDVLAVNELVTGLSTLAVGVALLAYGARVRQKAVIVLGSVSVGFGLVSAALLTIRVETLTHWGTLTAIGTALIFGAAALDRNRQALQRRLLDLHTRMRAWNY